MNTESTNQCNQQRTWKVLLMKSMNTESTINVINKEHGKYYQCNQQRT